MNEPQRPAAAKPYNLLATFPDRAAAGRAVEALRRQGLSDKSISLQSRGAAPEVDRAEMRDELEGMVAGPGAVATGPMSIGSFAGGALGAVVGAVLGFAIGALIYGTGGGSVVIISAIVGAVALATFGATAGGFLGPRSRKEAGDGVTPPGNDLNGAGPQRTRGADPAGREVVVGVQVEDEPSLEGVQGVLEAAHPLRLDVVSPDGSVLGTQELGLNAPPVQPGTARQVQTGGEEVS